MIQWQGTTDATNSATTAEEFDTITSTLIEGIDYWDEVDDDGPPYLTFLEGWRFRFDHYQAHPWYDGRPTSLVPVDDRPRRIEEAGHARRWTSGFV